MDRCPLCRARLHGAATCRRCRAELGTAQRVAGEAAALLGAAMHRLAHGEVAAATPLLRRAAALHATPEARALLRLLDGRAG
jgi:hypothetical protein